MRRIRGYSVTKFIDHPYVAKAAAYKVQTHCHSTGSDGEDTPTAVVTAYKNAGYHAVCLTDHEVATADPAVADITFIPGHEESSSQGHIVFINSNGNMAAAAAQADITAIKAARGIPVLNHPNEATNLWTEAERDAITDSLLCGIEVYSAKRDATPLQAYAEDVIDRELSLGKRYNIIASDDCHNIAGLFNMGWVVCFADANTLANLLEALRAGNFYASQGPELTLSVAGNTVTVTAEAASLIEFISDGGAVAQSTAGATEASYDIPLDTATYVRARMTRDSDSKIAWSNPVYIRNVRRAIL